MSRVKRLEITCEHEGERRFVQSVNVLIDMAIICENNKYDKGSAVKISKLRKIEFKWIRE